MASISSRHFHKRFWQFLLSLKNFGPSYKMADVFVPRDSQLFHSLLIHMQLLTIGYVAM